MKVVIANSLGIDSKGYYIIHSPSRWSEGVRKKENRFVYYPWELAYCSSLLKRETGHDVKFLDGCLESLDGGRYTRRIIEEDPDWLIMESASRVIEDNLRVALRVKKETDAKLVFTGHHASAFPEYLKAKGVDYVCIGEYEYTVLELLENKDPRKIPGLYPNGRRGLLDINKLPWPEDQDVSRLSYGMPGEPSSEYPEIQAYASRGCAASCNFCVARNVYYASPNWRPRSINDLIGELKYLRGKYPRMKGIFFDEETHNGNKDFILKLTDAIVKNGLDELKYEAMCSINKTDREILKAMKKAGYYKIRFGIETPDKEVLRRSGKMLPENDMIRNLELIKSENLKTYGTFMIGMPGSSPESDKATCTYISDTIKQGLLDNVQISICTPQPGTPFYRLCADKKYLITDDFSSFDGGRIAVVSYPGYSNKKIEHVMKAMFSERERSSFLRHLKSKDIIKWIAGVYRRHGFVTGSLKLLRRIWKEAIYPIRKAFYRL